MSTKYLLNTVVTGKDLTYVEAKRLMHDVLLGVYDDITISSFLTALRMKGESVSEIRGFIEVMRNTMQRVSFDGVVIDTCGTGGDGKGTFNISTACAFVVSGCGVKVAKHGNRASSSLSGSADVLEALGVNIQLSPNEAQLCLEKTGITFLFAPIYHSSMQHVSRVRKSLGFRTVFNFLGPFVNPAGVTRQVVGVATLEIAERLAQVSRRLGYHHLFIVSSEDGLDEVSIFSPTHVFEIRGSAVSQFVFDPHKYQFDDYVSSQVQGGNAQTNADILRFLLNGQKGAERDIVVLNSAFSLIVSGKASNIEDGIRQANNSIDSGSAKKALEQFISFSNRFRKN